MSSAPVPQNTGAEEAVVASVLVAERALPGVRERVQIGDFLNGACRYAFDAACRIHDRGDRVDQLTVAAELGRNTIGSNGSSRTALDEAGGMGWLSKIVADLPTPIGVESYADIVHHNATLRQLLSVSVQIADMARQGGSEVDEIMRRAEALIADVTGTPSARAEPFTATSLDELLAESDDETESEVFVTDGGDGAVVSRRSKVAVAAGTGVGKTNMALGWGRSFGEASPFLGLPIPEPRRVLYIPLEGSARNGRRRLHKLWSGSDSSARERFAVARIDRLDLMDAGQIARLDTLIFEHEPDVLIIDPLRHAHGLDENSNTEMALLTAVLDGIISRHNLALILPHHDRKRAPFVKRDTGTDRVRGASAFTGWLTSCLTLDRDPSGPDRFLAEWVKTRDAEEQMPPLNLDFNRATLQFTIADRTPDGVVTVDQIITAIWRDGGSARGTDLIQGFVEGAGAREKSVREAIRALVKDGRLEEFIADEDRKAGAKSYRLPEEDPEGLPGVES